MNTLKTRWNSIKAKAIALAATVLGGSAVFAQDAGDTPIDTTAASGAVTKIKTAVTTLFTTSLIPSVLAIVGVGLAVWLIFIAIRYMKRAGSSR